MLVAYFSLYSLVDFLILWMCFDCYFGGLLYECNQRNHAVDVQQKCNALQNDVLSQLTFETYNDEGIVKVKIGLAYFVTILYTT